MQMAVKYHSFSLNVSDKRGNQLFCFGVSTEKQCYTGNIAVLMERWFLTVIFISCCRFLHSREYSNPQHFYLNMERKTYTSGNYYPGKSAHVLVWLAESSLRISNMHIFSFFVWLHDYRKAEMLCKVELKTEHSDLQISNFISNLFTIECRKHIKYLNREVVQL